jgi:hypothetical protein
MNALRVCKLRKNCLPALTSAQWCYLNAFMIVNYRKVKKYIQSEQQIFTAHIYIGCLIVNYKTRRCSDTLKIHKIENFFDSDFGICVISLLVMSKD